MNSTRSDTRPPPGPGAAFAAMPAAAVVVDDAAPDLRGPAPALPDVVVVELRVPGIDPVALARFLHERHGVGVVVLGASARDAGVPDPAAVALEARALLARAKGAAPRPEPAPAPVQRVRVGRCWFELETRRLLDDAGAELALTAMEYDLLRVLVANPNRVLSRDQLLMRTRNRDWEPFDRSIDIRIGRLRRKVERNPGAEPRTIRTVRSAGYMFVPDPGPAIHPPHTR